MLQQFLHLNPETATCSNPLQGEWTTIIINGSIGPLALTINGNHKKVIRCINAWTPAKLPKPELQDLLKENGFQFIITELYESPDLQHSYIDQIAVLPMIPIDA